MPLPVSTSFARPPADAWLRRRDLGNAVGNAVGNPVVPSAAMQGGGTANKAMLSDVNGWSDATGDLFCTKADNAVAYTVLHSAMAASYRSLDAWIGFVLLIAGMGTGAGGAVLASLVDPSWVAGVTSVVLFIVSAAHKVRAALGYEDLATRHSGLAVEWSSFSDSMRAQLDLPRTLRTPLTACYGFYMTQFERLSARSKNLIRPEDTAAFQRVMAAQAAQRKKLGYGAGCGCETEGIRVPEDLGGRLTHAHECRDVTQATAPLLSEQALEQEVTWSSGGDAAAAANISSSSSGSSGAVAPAMTPLGTGASAASAAV